MHLLGQKLGGLDWYIGGSCGGHCLGDGEGGAQWDEGLHHGQIVGGGVGGSPCDGGGSQDWLHGGELGKEIDEEAQQRCSLLEGMEDTKEVETIFHQVEIMGPYGLVVIGCL